MFELQLILLPQSWQVVTAINASLNWREVFLLYGLCVVRNRGKRQKCQQGGFYVEYAFLPSLAEELI